MAKIVALLQDAAGMQGKFIVPNGVVANVMSFLAAECKAGVVGVNLVEAIAVTATNPAEGFAADEKALLYYTADGTPHSFCVPGCKVLTEMTPEGVRVVRDGAMGGETMCEEYHALTGGEGEVVFTSGIIVDHNI